MAPRLGILGSGPAAEALAAALARSRACRVVGLARGAEGAGGPGEPEAPSSALAARLGVPWVEASALALLADVVCVFASPGEGAALAAEVVAEGAHVFLPWPPAAGPAEAERLLRRAEEAGVEVGVARPPLAGRLAGGVRAATPEGWVPAVALVDVVLPEGGSEAWAGGAAWAHHLAGALALLAALARRPALARAEAAACREGAAVRTLAAGLRFRTGTYAHLALRVSPEGGAPTCTLHAAGAGSVVTERDLAAALAGLQPGGLGASREASSPEVGEALAFAEAVTRGEAAPFGLGEAVGVLRLAEEVLARLR